MVKNDPEQKQNGCDFLDQIMESFKEVKTYVEIMDGIKEAEKSAELFRLAESMRSDVKPYLSDNARRIGQSVAEQMARLRESRLTDDETSG